MKTITIRNIPPEVEKLIRRRSRKEGLSANRAVLSLLCERAGITERGHKKQLHHDLDHLAGVWTNREGLRFEENLLSERSVDESLWD